MYQWGYEPVAGTGRVAVPIFTNKTLRRGYEIDLTQHLRRRILDATPLQLAREGEGAPVVRGTITSVVQGVVVPNTTDTLPPFEGTIQITISVEVRSEQGTLLAGGPDGGPAILTESESFVPTFNQSAGTAADRVLKKLAERVVDLLERGWGGAPRDRDDR
jgi:hypothetical protein